MTLPRDPRSDTNGTGAPGIAMIRCACGREQLESFGAPLIDMAELARWLATSTRRVRRLVEEQRVPYLKIGHYVRFDPVDISQWIEGQKVSMAAREGTDDRPLWVRLSTGEGRGLASAPRPRRVSTGKGEEGGQPLWLRDQAGRER